MPARSACGRRPPRRLQAWVILREKGGRRARGEPRLHGFEPAFMSRRAHVTARSDLEAVGCRTLVRSTRMRIHPAAVPIRRRGPRGRRRVEVRTAAHRARAHGVAPRGRSRRSVPRRVRLRARRRGRFTTPRRASPAPWSSSGCEPGDRVATLIENSPEATLAWWGILTAGAVAVPVNTAYKGSYLRPPARRLGVEGARRRGVAGRPPRPRAARSGRPRPRHRDRRHRRARSPGGDRDTTGRRCSPPIRPRRRSTCGRATSPPSSTPAARPARRRAAC